MVRGRCCAAWRETHVVARLSRRILNRVERGAWPRCELYVREWDYFDAAAYWRLTLHRKQRQVSAPATNRLGMEPVRPEDSFARRLRDVQRSARLARLPHRSKRAIQSGVQHSGAKCFAATDRSCRGGAR